MYERQDEMTTPDEWREAMLISRADDLWDADDQESNKQEGLTTPERVAHPMRTQNGAHDD